jgi:hypothetical protein
MPGAKAKRQKKAADGAATSSAGAPAPKKSKKVKEEVADDGGDEGNAGTSVLKSVIMKGGAPPVDEYCEIKDKYARH